MSFLPVGSAATYDIFFLSLLPHYLSVSNGVPAGTVGVSYLASGVAGVEMTWHAKESGQPLMISFKVRVLLLPMLFVVIVVVAVIAVIADVPFACPFDHSALRGADSTTDQLSKLWLCEGRPWSRRRHFPSPASDRCVNVLWVVSGGIFLSLYLSVCVCLSVCLSVGLSAMTLTALIIASARDLFGNLSMAIWIERAF
jgi:hypothetical protein